MCCGNMLSFHHSLQESFWAASVVFFFFYVLVWFCLFICILVMLQGTLGTSQPSRTLFKLHAASLGRHEL